MQERNIIRSHSSLIRPQLTDIIRKSTIFLIRHSLPKGCSLRAGGLGVISPYNSQFLIFTHIVRHDSCSCAIPGDLSERWAESLLVNLSIMFRPGRISRLPFLLLVLGWCGGACESTWEEDLHDILRAAAALFHFFFFLRVTSKYSEQSENSSGTPSLETPRPSSLTTCVVQQTKWVWACVCVQDRLEVGMNGILARVCRSPFKRYGRYMSAEVNGSAYAAKSCAIWVEMSTYGSYLQSMLKLVP